MTTKHTQEPFAIGLECDDAKTQIISSDGSHICYVECDPHLANARRFVACINAFDGVDDDAIAELPEGKVSGILRLAAKGLVVTRELRSQRDELAAAAREALKLLEKGAPGWGVSKDLLRAALAKLSA